MNENVSYSLLNGPQTFEKIHVEAATNIANGARIEHCENLIHISALGANEASLAQYARSKARGEAAVLEAFPRAVILRPSVIFGPEDNFFNLFAQLMSILPVMFVIGAPLLPQLRMTTNSGFKIKFLGNGGPMFQPVYVGDVVAAIIKTLNYKNTEGQIFELGGPRTYSFSEILKLIMHATKKRKLLLPMPFWAAEIQALLMSWLPRPLLTRDQVALLKTDNVIDGNLAGLSDLGITATPADAIIPLYLNRFSRDPERGLRRD